MPSLCGQGRVGHKGSLSLRYVSRKDEQPDTSINRADCPDFRLLHWKITIRIFSCYLRQSDEPEWLSSLEASRLARATLVAEQHEAKAPGQRPRRFAVDPRSDESTDNRAIAERRT